MENTNAQTNYLNSPLTVLQGIGPKKAQLFARLGIHSIWDLLYYFPTNYDDRRSVYSISQCPVSVPCCICIKPVRSVIERRLKQKLSLFLLYATDGADTVTIKWFSSPFTKPKLMADHMYNVYGVMTSQNGKKEFELRYIEDASDPRYTQAIVPVYRATNGLTSKSIAQTVSLALDGIDSLSDSLPGDIIKTYSLMPIYDAVYTMHRPGSMEALSSAHNRLAFEELFVLSLALSSIKKRRTDKEGTKILAAPHVREFASHLPFTLTDGQKNAINEICADLKSGKPMNRLVQGDVGCGKTAVAASVIYAVAKSGSQSAFMAPTEILAFQHYETLKKLLGDSVRIALVTSSVKKKEKLISDIANGDYDVVVGTHALIEGRVKFLDLALCIVDEQHRFGVNQRALLSSKGMSCHMLVMSATPIPRTLSLILYGDLDISVIKSMPKGRQSIETYHIDSAKKDRAYAFLKKEVQNGHQCYIVCPLVEESEAIEASSVQNTVDSLKSGALSGLGVECIHGKMKADEKDDIMLRFKNNEINVLVSTTVIEVGVDVPNATVMMIENAERFGLSQLHQLRGRVGRGKDRSYCILVSDSKSDNAKERMKIMEKSSDGFEISQKDLELRGSGQFFGTRQHGVPELKVANLFSDSYILQSAAHAAAEILKKDPDMEDKSLLPLKGRIRALFEDYGDNNIFN